MEVEVTVDGRTYVAEVHEVDGAVTVITDAGGIETTTIGGSSVESIARTGKVRPKAN
ncbi:MULTISPECIES: hypothetical protein [Burkholderia]|jgi:hypothetical protein|uniref:hypothetical protein n=1 Tax=Burkholderia TaxID=32008 RepID=UPI00158BEC6A|nr:MULTISPECIES: hypothetical protein [Burkholderia]